MPGWSLTGSVFGMHATAVNPPATADAVPVAIVSLCSWPGSRRCTWMSMSPGATIQPGLHVEHLGAVGRQRLADARDAAVLDQDVELAVTPVRGVDHASAFQQRLHQSVLVLLSGEQIQHRHPHRDAVGDLLEDHRIRAVGDVGIDLDAAVHRPGVHDDHVGLGARRTRSGVRPNSVKYSRVDGMKWPCIRSCWMRSIMTTSAPATASSIDVVGAHAEARQLRRHQRRRPAGPDLGAHLVQQLDVRAQHAAVQQVADDRDLQSVAAASCARES